MTLKEFFLFCKTVPSLYSYASEENNQNRKLYIQYRVSTRTIVTREVRYFDFDPVKDIFILSDIPEGD